MFINAMNKSLPYSIKLNGESGMAKCDEFLWGGRFQLIQKPRRIANAILLFTNDVTFIEIAIFVKTKI